MPEERRPPTPSPEPPQRPETPPQPVPPPAPAPERERPEPFRRDREGGQPVILPERRRESVPTVPRPKPTEEE
jgi:hypothetical protein